MRAILMLFIVMLSPHVIAADSVTLRIATAANFYPTLKKITNSYEKIQEIKYI